MHARIAAVGLCLAVLATRRRTSGAAYRPPPADGTVGSLRSPIAVRQDGHMRKPSRILPWALFALILVIIGATLIITGLDRADKLSSVVGALAGIAGLAVSVYGILSSRDGGKAPGVRQTVDSTEVGGNLTQAISGGQGVKVVGGDLSTVGPEGIQAAGETGNEDIDQSVKRSRVKGHLTQVDNDRGAWKEG